MATVAIQHEHYPPDSSEIALRQVLLGVQPALILEPLDVPDDAPEDEPLFKVTTSLATLTELRPLLDILIQTIDANEGA